MRRRSLLQFAGATALLAMLPKTAQASTSLDSYFASAFDRIVAPVCTNLVRPVTLERADSRPFWYTTFNDQLGLTQVSYGRGMRVPETDYEATHESGHALAVLLGYRYPNWIKDFLSYHGSTLALDELPQFNEIFAEHFAAALGMPFYLGYPELRAKVPFRSVEDTRGWIGRANRLCDPVPPVEGAKYAGSSADRAQMFWLYPDGSVHR